MEFALVKTKPEHNELLYCLSYSKAALIIQSGSGNQVIVKGKAVNLADGDGIQGVQFRFIELQRESKTGTMKNYSD